ncbi:MAG TPA: glycosyltransferase [Candidatus Kapabacteria bacterium]
MPEKKYVLFVSYYFPPAGGPGVQRVAKFARYLGEFGWTPIMLVPENPEYQALDESLAKELPADLIIRKARIFEPYDLYRKFTGVKKGVSLDVAVNKRGAKKSFTQRVAEFIRATFFIPDARIGWYKNGVAEGMKITKEYPISMIYSSSPPYTVSLVARKISKLSGIPWVAGFRDPWTGFESSTPNRWFLPKAIDKKLERSVFTDAKMVDVAWEGIREDVRGKYPEIPASKFVHIPNGFDSADFPEHDITKRAIRQRGEKFVITYSGSLYGPRNPKTFLEAIQKLIASGAVEKEKLHLRFVGRFGPDIHEMLDAPAVVSMVEKIDYVAHSRAVELVQDSDALLLIVDDTATVGAIVPGKVYEYLGAMRPLIAFAPPDGAIGDLLKETGGGKAIAQSDADSAAAYIKTLYDAWGRGEQTSSVMKTDIISKYERREETRRLAEVFDSLVK